MILISIISYLRGIAWNPNFVFFEKLIKHFLIIRYFGIFNHFSEIYPLAMIDFSENN